MVSGKCMPKIVGIIKNTAFSCIKSYFVKEYNNEHIFFIIMILIVILRTIFTRRCLINMGRLLIFRFFFFSSNFQEMMKYKIFFPKLNDFFVYVIFFQFRITWFFKIFWDIWKLIWLIIYLDLRTLLICLILFWILLCCY